MKAGGRKQSDKRNKIIANKKFRRRTKIAINSEREEDIPTMCVKFLTLGALVRMDWLFMILIFQKSIWENRVGSCPYLFYHPRKYSKPYICKEESIYAKGIQKKIKNKMGNIARTTL